MVAVDGSEDVQRREHHMHMRVDDSGESRSTRVVDGLVGVQVPADRDNPVGLDHNIGLDDLTTFHIEDAAPRQDGSHVPIPPSNTDTMASVTSVRRAAGSGESISALAADMIRSCRNRPTRSYGRALSSPASTPLV